MKRFSPDTAFFLLGHLNQVKATSDQYIMSYDMTQYPSNFSRVEMVGFGEGIAMTKVEPSPCVIRHLYQNNLLNSDEAMRIIIACR